MAATELSGAPDDTPIGTAVRTVFAGDVGRDGRFRLDGVLRFLQDVAGEQLRAVGGIGPAWVVRRCLIEVRHPARLHEDLTLHTWCSGVGRCWIERRTTMDGGRGACIEAVALWVHIDASTGRPQSVPSDALGRLGGAGLRAVDPRLGHDPLVPPTAGRVPWHVRAADLDVLGHVNNAIAGAAVEEALAITTPPGSAPTQVELEYRRPLGPGDDVAVVVDAESAGTLRLWVLGDQPGAAEAGRTAAVTAVVRSGEPGGPSATPGGR